MPFTRTVSGKLYDSDTDGFGAWVRSAAFTIDARGYAHAHPALIYTIVPGLVGSTDGGTCRESHRLDLGLGNLKIWYDAGDGTHIKPGTNWQVHTATVTGYGRGLSKDGPAPIVRNGSFESYCMAGFVRRLGPTWYIWILPSASNDQGIPVEHYISSLYTSTSENGPWTWVQDYPLDPAGQPGDFDAYVGCVFELNGVWQFFKGVRQNGGQPGNSAGYNVRRYTSPTIDGVLTADPAGVALTTSVVSSDNVRGSPENPDVFQVPAIGQWLMLTNRVGSASTDATDIFVTPDPTQFQSASTFRLVVQTTSDTNTTIDATNSVGVATVLRDANGNAQLTPDGLAAGITYDCDGGSGIGTTYPNTHEARKIRPAQLLFAPAALRSQSATPGTQSPSWAKLHLGTHRDHVAELEFTQVSGSGTNDWLFQVCGTSPNLTPDFDGDGYLVYIAPAGNVFLALQIAGSFVGTFSPTPNTTVQSENRANLQCTNRIKWMRAGNTFQVWLNNQTPGPVLQGSLPNPGFYLGARTNGGFDNYALSVRLYTGSTVTLTGLPPGASVRLLGAGYTEFAIGTADPNGTLVIGSPHFPIYQIQVDVAAPEYPFAEDGVTPAGRVYGGDSFSFSPPPPPPTPIVTAVGGIDSATVTVTQTNGDPVTVFVSPVMTVPEWTVFGHRTGDGTVTGALPIGYYLFYASRDSDLLPSPPAVAYVDTATLAVYTRVAEAVASVIGLLNLGYTVNAGTFPIAGIYRQWSEIPDNLKFPCVLLSKARVSETDESRTNATIDTGYPVLVQLIDRRSPGDEAMNAYFDLWRQKINRAFNGNQLPTPHENWICRVEFGAMATPGGQNFEFKVSEMTIRAICREPRGINA